MIRSAAIFFGLALALSGCASAPLEDTPTRAQIAESTLPPMKGFTTARPYAPARSNGNIAADFLSLHFELESGRELPILTRFETPITVRVTGSAIPPSLNSDLGRLLARLRREAGIDIQQVTHENASVTIQPVSRAEIRKALPHAACFVVPNVSSFDEYRRDRRKSKTNWSNLQTRERLAIFLPNDSSPQEVRDCLHEELAQAIGPLNDLYRLPDSVFNDDNVHRVLTGFDMLVLRATYSPELRSGMSRGEVAAVLPELLSRLNPRGNAIASTPVVKTPRSWIEDVQTAYGPRVKPEERIAAATRAAQTAERMGWTDHRRAFSLYLLGLMTQSRDLRLSQQYFGTALHYLAQTPGTEVHKAYITAQTAAYALTQGDGATALRQVRGQIETAARAENAELLSTLMLLEAEGYDLAGQHDRAASVRLDSVGWARYGSGSDWAVRAKMQNIATLSPVQRFGG
ncbi:DUF2927 domain-containing protein [Primorskyibacter sp. S87]|uniref:DUF2927 domain-containing protein n=1 Tax=Primorskyibacter sp. S87 TaxID=3415126 RepID=UPI003C7ECFA6